MATGYDGFAALGDVLMGGPQQRAEAEYPKHLRESATASQALDRAAIVRAQRIARESLPAAISAHPVLGQNADLGTAILGMATGQPNLGTYTKGLGDVADMELDAQIRQKLELGDVAGAQVLSAVKTDKVLPEVAAAGKMVFTPVTGGVDMTALGDAAVGATDALAGQRSASGEASLIRAGAAAGKEAAHARVYDAQADAGGFNPNTGRKPKGKFGDVVSGSDTVPANDPLLAQAMEAITKGADPAAVKARLIEMGRADLAGGL